MVEMIDQTGDRAAAYAAADRYQTAANKFAQYGGNAMYPALGLCEEAGEVAGKIAKFIRRNAGMEPATARGSFGHAMKGEVADFNAALKKELGDVCWMVAALATEFGLSFGEILKGNIEKLEARAVRGTIIGEGDER